MHATITEGDSPTTQLKVERLPPVETIDLIAQVGSDLRAPDWLRPLWLASSRHNIRCLKPRTRVVKRALDLVVASTLLVVTLPILLAAIVAIKLTSRGPVFFTQTRVGLNQRRGRGNDVGPPTDGCRRKDANYGRPFTIYKLRTMSATDSSNSPTQTKAADSRVTSVGRLLRRMRIDELPQLVNVLRGEMSMVGPRPECIEYMEELNAKVPNYAQRLGLKPGLTGIAQIEAGYANDLDSYRKKVAFDLVYLQNCCLGNDLRIMWRTVRVVLTGFGAL